MVKKNPEFESLQREQLKKEIEKEITRFHKTPLSKIKDFLGMFIGIILLACICLVTISAVFVMIMILIENPLSLAILCGTILLIIIWSSR